MGNDTPGRYATVGGLKLYYEVHGSGAPLVLLHGAYQNIETAFGALLPALAAGRQVIAVELEGHGRSADSDRPLSYEQMADDVAALLRQIGIAQADIFGYSLGAGVALQIGLRHRALVRKLVLLSVSYNSDGVYPELLAAMEGITPETFAGSPMEAEYLRLAPDPTRWPRFVARLKELDLSLQEWSPEAIRAMGAPTLLIAGDADIIRPEHTVALFRLLGGGVIGDFVGLPPSRLAVLPGATHVTAIDQTDLLLAIIPPFLAEPLPEAAGDGDAETPAR